MTDKYTLAEIRQYIEITKDNCFTVQVGDRRMDSGTTVKQLLSDHETMREALLHLYAIGMVRRYTDICKIVEKALSEVTK